MHNFLVMLWCCFESFFLCTSIHSVAILWTCCSCTLSSFASFPCVFIPFDLKGYAVWLKRNNFSDVISTCLSSKCISSCIIKTLNILCITWWRTACGPRPVNYPTFPSHSNNDAALLHILCNISLHTYSIIITPIWLPLSSPFELLCDLLLCVINLYSLCLLIFLPLL